MEWPLVGRDAILRRLSVSISAGKVAGVEVIGEPGVGKSRLAKELARVAATEGRNVLSLQGSIATADVPFGVLDEHRLRSQRDGFRHPADALEALSVGDPGGGRGLLVLDDAHLVDAASANLIRSAASSSTIFVVLTRRAGSPVVPVLTEAWKDGLLDRVDLEPLGEQATQALAEAALGGPVSQRTSSDLWRLSLGHPLYLRELILGSVASGALVLEAGEWHARRELRPSASLIELVRSIIGPIDRPALPILETLAIAERLGLCDLEQLGPSSAFEQLEERAVVAFVEDGRRLDVQFRHPIYGEVIRATIPRLRQRSRTAWLADRIENRTTRRVDDDVKLARWRLDAGELVEPGLLLSATKRALTLREAGVAEGLARAALRSTDNLIPARILLAEALACQQRFDEALAILFQASTEARTDDEVGRVALVRADLLYYRVGRAAEATEILTACLETLSEPDWRYDVEALLRVFRSEATDSRPSPWDGARLPAVGARARGLHTVMHATLANIMNGRFVEAETAIRRALDPGPGIAMDHPFAAEMLRVNGVYVDLYTGRIESALAEAAAGHRAALQAGAVESVGIWATILSEGQALGGDIEGALQTMLGALALTERRVAHAERSVHIAWASILLSWLGREVDARAMWRRSVDLDVPQDVRARIPLDRASVWLTWVEAGSRAAAVEALTAGERAAAESRPLWAAFLLHDAVRLGHPDLVSERLPRIVKGIDGDLFQVIGRHAEVLAARDGRELEGIATEYERLGVLLFAAEAGAQAQRVYLSTGEPRAARAAASRTAAILGRCSGLRTPALADAAPVALTDRERDVARLAIRGDQSREIADRLGISVRTVDNHLGSVYAKLGISHREDLTSVLGPDLWLAGSPG